MTIDGKATEKVDIRSINIGSKLKWNKHADYLLLAQQLNVLCRLRVFDVGAAVMIVLYKAGLENLNRYGMVSRYSTLSVQSESIFNRLKQCMKSNRKCEQAALNL